MQAGNKRLATMLVGFAIAAGVQAQGLPDLTVVTVSGPATAGTAQSVPLTSVLANTGAAAGNWRYRIYLSTDATITTNDTVIATLGPFASFAAGTQATNVDVVTIPAAMAPGTNYFGVLIDDNNAVAETNEANNARASAPVNIVIGPDLTVIAVAGPAQAGTAQTITLTNVLANIGLGAAGSWRYRIYLSPDATITTNDTVLTTQGTYVNFPAGTAFTNTASCTIPAATPPGTYYFGVIIDDNDGVAESVETNNSGVSGPVAIGIGPDLTVTAVVGPSVAGTAQSLTITNTLANVGVGAAGSWRYRIYLSPDATITTNDIVLATQGAFGSFAAGTSVVNADTITIPATTVPGAYYFGVIIDFDNGVVESNEANNVLASGPVLIQIGPDLSVLSVTGPAGAAAAQTVALTSVLANVGVGAAGSWSYRVYLSPDPLITTSDTVLTTQGAFVNFPAGAASTNQLQVTIPPSTAPGTYYLGAIIDYDNVVVEANEANNAGASGPVMVGLVITSMTYQAGTVSLDIAGLAVSNTYRIDYNSQLTGPAPWSTGALFMAQGAVTNWADPGAAAATTRFYRVTQP